MADKVILVPIYAAREKDIYNINSLMLPSSINENINNKSIYMNNFEEVIDYINENANQNDIVCIMGAGDIDNIFKVLTNKNNN